MSLHMPLTGLLAVAIAACSSPSIGAEEKAKSGKPSLKVAFLRVSPKPEGFGYLSLEFKASNPTATKAPYTGYVPGSFAPPLKKATISPWYRIEYQRKGKWEKHPIGWCGFGLGPVAIEPKRSATFNVPVYIVKSQPFGNWDAVRVGIVCHAKNKAGGTEKIVAWSKPVLRKQLAKFEKQ